MSGIKSTLRKAMRTAGFYPLHVSNPKPPKNGRNLHFLHIGKNAGTQVFHVAEGWLNAPQPVRLVKHGHDVMLRHLPTDAEYFFSVRDPVSRFVSGFYNRKTEGRPVRVIPRTEAEDRVFDRFAEAVELAEALFQDGEQGRAAAQAMTTLRHAAQHQWQWFMMQGHFLDLRPPAYILRQEHFATDLAALQRKLGVEGHTDDAPTKSRKTDYSAIPELTERARENLLRWYAADMAFYSMCCDWVAAQDV